MSYYYYSGNMQDELAWAASWIYKATGLSKYTEYIVQQKFCTSSVYEFNWDLKSAGVQVLMSSVS